ncbi:MAG TPA: chorismate-binding protein, partial [Gemmatimonadaceae bacterium]
MSTIEFSAVSTFPAIGGSGQRLAFRSPSEVIVAETLEDVRAALECVDRATQAGKWAVGFVAYDAAPAFDSALEVPPRIGDGPPLVCFGVFDAPVAIADVHTHADMAESVWTPHVSRAHYASSVERIRQGIRDGDFYQVNHTVRLCTAIDPASTSDLFGSMHAAQPNSYAMELEAGRWAILSVSPELFFARTGNAIETRPMKGTVSRGRWFKEDARYREQLAASEKDRAENVMIVDLVRNDLGRIAKTGTVDVPRLFEIEQHPTVWQMTSTITATLRHDVTLTDIFSALFPCG